MSTSLIKI